MDELSPETLNGLHYNNREAQRTFYDTYSPYVFRYARRLLSDPHLAEDVTQDVFKNVFRRPPDPQRPESARAFVLRCAHNACISAMNKRRRRQTSELIADSIPCVKALEPSSYSIEKEWAEAVQIALNRLGDNDRAIIHLRIYEGLSNPEVAEILGIANATAQQRYQRAVNRLRNLMSGPRWS